MASNMKNMNFAITVDDGSRRVPILNTEGEEIGAFRFHPTDIGIIGRFNRLADRFASITEPLEAIPLDGDGAADLEDPKLTEALKEAERRLSEAVNELFNSDDAAAAFFGKMHPFSPVNGDFYATQVLQQVGAFIGAQFDTETRLLTRRVNKFSAEPKTADGRIEDSSAAPIALSKKAKKYLK